jgi:hypothetical protein
MLKYMHSTVGLRFDSKKAIACCSRMARSGVRVTAGAAARFSAALPSVVVSVVSVVVGVFVVTDAVDGVKAKPGRRTLITDLTRLMNVSTLSVS